MLSFLFAECVQIVGCVAVAEKLQPRVCETLAALRGVGIRQVLLAGADKHVALAAARHCGLLTSFEWNNTVTAGTEGIGQVRNIGPAYHHLSGLPSGAAGSLAADDGDYTSHGDSNEPTRVNGNSCCRQCYEDMHLASSDHPADEMHQNSPRAFCPGTLHGLVTNTPASLSQWAVADANYLLQRCSAELTYYARKDRRRLQSPSASLWACECGTTVSRRRVLKTSIRRRSFGGEGRRIGEFLADRSCSRTRGYFGRDRDATLYQREILNKDLRPRRRVLRHRIETKEGQNVSLSSLPLRRKLRIGRCFVQVFEDMWRQSRVHGQGICLLSDAASLAFFFSHKLLQVGIHIKLQSLP